MGKSVPTGGEPEILRTPTIEPREILEFVENAVPDRSPELTASEFPKEPRILDNAREVETTFRAARAFSQT